MSTLLLPDQTYGDAYRKSLKPFKHSDIHRNRIISPLKTTKKANELKCEHKMNNRSKIKSCDNVILPQFRLNEEPESVSETYYNVEFDDRSVNDDASVYSFTSESEEEPSPNYLPVDSQLGNDGYSQEMSRLLKGIRIWETGDSMKRKQNTQHAVGSDVIENKKAWSNKRSTSWDAFRSRQKTKQFLSKNNIRPEFFCQHKHFIG